MSLQELLAALERDAEAELAAADRASRERADAILADARQEAAAIRERVLREQEAIATEQASRLLARARLEAAAVTRTGQAAELDELRRATEQALLTRTDHTVTAGLLAELLAVLPSVDTVRVRRQDTGTATAFLSQRGRTGVQVVADLPADQPGVIGYCVAERRELDNTVATRLRNTWPAVRSQVVAGWDAAARAPHPDAALEPVP